MIETQRAGKWRGLVIAIFVYLLWFGNLLFWLSVDLETAAWWTMALAIPVQTFLYTGLFITAHDAMHNAVVSDFPRLNRWIGRIAVISYALFSYARLQRQHGLHHSFPASEKDPDYHDGLHTDPVRWFVHFMSHYLTWQQITGMALLFNALHYLLQVPVFSLLLFWVLPALLSTVQLFYFGTYLPHRSKGSDRDDVHGARSSGYPVWLSFMTCYHFGYHLEHHLYPRVPWWQLPGKRIS